MKNRFNLPVAGRAGARGVLAALGLSLVLGAAPALAAERGALREFLEVTGFGVALDNLGQSASDAPALVGLDAGDFGIEWNRVASDVFHPDAVRGLAMDMLDSTLDDALLGHAADFYASPLGQRLVKAENAAAAETDDIDREGQGIAIVDALVRSGAPRLATLKRMVAAVNGMDATLHALTEIQFRFLLAADAAEVIRLRRHGDALREALQSSTEGLRMRLRQSALISAAYVYRDFDDSDLARYAEALEQEEMRRVYALMNAVQYEIVANRFEVLADRLADLHPGQEI